VSVLFPTQDALHHTRVVTASLGVLALVGLGATGFGVLRVPLTAVAVVALVLAAVATIAEARSAQRQGVARGETAGPNSGAPPGSARRWCGWPAALALFGIVTAASQTWFKAGTALAGGDISPPIGTAWMTRLFEPWVWTGSSLGAPNTSSQQLPWAVVDLVVHGLGGNGTLAQRLWLSGLFVAAALAGYWLLRVLRFGPIPAAVGALVYAFNPYVLSNVGDNDVYLAAMVLVAAWPAIVLSIARGRWRIRWGLVAFVASAPLAGFVYANPPLLGLAGAGTVVAGLAGIWLGGRTVIRRSLIAVAGGLVALAVASSYWLVPAIVALRDTGVGLGLSTTSSWAWTEGRMSVANGLWLNTTWGWKFALYYPYAHLYDELPLSVLKYLLPAAAFSSLAVAGRLGSAGQRHRARLAAGAALVSLLLIVAGTGTNMPGAIIFDPFYHLPLGWVLQDPGRFLMAAGLGYGVMVAVALEATAEAIRRWRPHVAARRMKERVVGGAWPAIAPLLAAALAIVIAFPLAGGVLIPHYGGSFPSPHVHVPKYWRTLATALNRKDPSATVLILPPDDFYQMPYRWYYGNDGFITNLLSARVIDPAGQGYAPGSAELLQAVDRVSSALLAHQWQLASDLTTALGADELLVRGDIDSSYPGRTIVSPAALSDALDHDPLSRLSERAGPLSVYRIAAAGGARSPTVATVDTTRPDLGVLATLPPGTALVSGPVQPGETSVLQPPPLEDWPVVDGALQISLVEPAGRHYHLDTLPTPPAASDVRATAGHTPVSIHLLRRVSGGRKRVVLSAPLGAETILDGDFAHGPWGPVGNCDAVPHTTASADIRATVVAGGGPRSTPALRLSAHADRACEATDLDWSGGSVLLTLSYRAVAGAAPGLCVWEEGPDVCAVTPTLSDASGWHRVQVAITPGPRTQRLLLFLYATPIASGQVAVSEYADVSAYRFVGKAQPVLVAMPERRADASSHLVSATSAFAPSWSGPTGSRHVLVDGLRNGWLVAGPAPKASDPAPVYRPAWQFTLGWVMSLAIVSVTMVGLLVSLESKRRRHRLVGAPGESEGENGAARKRL